VLTAGDGTVNIVTGQPLAPLNVGSAVNLNIATGQSPLNTTATILAAQSDTNARRRALAYNYTGDKALTLTILFDLGGNIGLVQAATLGIVAGNVTPQKGIVYPTSGAAATGVSLQSGTAPTLGLAGSFDFLQTPAQQIRVDAAVASGPTTVGVLQLDLMEQA
jgi:hypothetical protein